jgi:hypothetical protein
VALGLYVDALNLEIQRPLISFAHWKVSARAELRLDTKQRQQRTDESSVNDRLCRAPELGRDSCCVPLATLRVGGLLRLEIASMVKIVNEPSLRWSPTQLLLCQRAGRRHVETDEEPKPTEVLACLLSG